MAGFKFDEVDQFTQNSSDKINFLKLQDDGWYANVRFMYGPNEMFEGQTVHNISDNPSRPKYVPCLRGLNDSLDVCPLCKNGSAVIAQFFIPVYVHSIVSNVRGVEQEQQVGQVMLFQRGSTFKGALQSVVRNTAGTGKPIVSSKFRLVRNGKAGDVKTNYTVEYIGTDDVTLDQLPPRPEILGSYILPKLTAEEMTEKYVNGNSNAAPTNASSITPRTLNASTFGNNTVVGGSNFNIPNPAVNANQAPVQAPTIGNVNTNGVTPF